MDKYNHDPVMMTEGKMILDGVTVSDGVKCEIKFTPDVYTGKVLGEKTPSSRWKGYTISVSVTRRRETPWAKDIIKKYIATGETPEFTIQGIMDDTGSDYYRKYGSDSVTVVGCVPTGDITLLGIDADGSELNDTITFNGKNVIFK
ncbi:MAG: phage tail tube protein [Porcipelethomonas sp.]